MSNDSKNHITLTIDRATRQLLVELADSRTLAMSATVRQLIREAHKKYLRETKKALDRCTY